jgi:hypothetical protein
VFLVARIWAPPAIYLLLKTKYIMADLCTGNDELTAIQLEAQSFWPDGNSKICSRSCFTIITIWLMFIQLRNWVQLDHSQWQFASSDYPIPSAPNIWFQFLSWFALVSLFVTALQIIMVGKATRKNLGDVSQSQPRLLILDPHNCGGFSRFGDLSLCAGSFVLPFAIASFNSAYANYLEGVSDTLIQSRTWVVIALSLLGAPLVTLGTVAGIPSHVRKFKATLGFALVREYNQLLTTYSSETSSTQRQCLRNEMSNLKDIIAPIQGVFEVPISRGKRTIAMIAYSTAVAPVIILLLTQYLDGLAP